MNPEGLSTEQLDKLIKQLQDQKAYKLSLIKTYQARIDYDYSPPVKLASPSHKMDVKSFWTKNIQKIIYYIYDSAPICFCCTERSTFELTDEYSKYALCYSCGKEVIGKVGFPISEIDIEY